VLHDKKLAKGGDDDVAEVGVYLEQPLNAQAVVGGGRG
jgi:hypothetical protein